MSARAEGLTGSALLSFRGRTEDRVDTAASENYRRCFCGTERWRAKERKRERERERIKSSVNKSEWKIYLKKKVPTWLIRSSLSTWVPEVCNWLVKETARLAERHRAREKKRAGDGCGGGGAVVEGVPSGWGGSVINPFTSSPVLFAPLDSARVSPFRLVYLVSRVWLKKIPTAWGGIGAGAGGGGVGGG